MQLREGPREIPQRGQGRNSRFRQEPAAFFDIRELQAREETEPHERQQRHGEQDEQPSGDGHIQVQIDALDGRPTLRAVKNQFTGARTPLTSV